MKCLELFVCVCWVMLVGVWDNVMWVLVSGLLVVLSILLVRVDEVLFCEWVGV